MHSAGWPLKNDVYGGSFLYHMEKNQISLGFVMGLDYAKYYEKIKNFKNLKPTQK